MISDEVLTVQEVARLFKVSRVTVWRWCQQGTLPAFKVGRGWRMRRGEVEKIMKQIDTGIGPPESIDMN